MVYHQLHWRNHLFEHPLVLHVRAWNLVCEQGFTQLLPNSGLMVYQYFPSWLLCKQHSPSHVLV
jgi:hypothetical protein